MSLKSKLANMQPQQDVGPVKPRQVEPQQEVEYSQPAPKVSVVNPIAKKPASSAWNRSLRTPEQIASQQQQSFGGNLDNNQDVRTARGGTPPPPKKAKVISSKGLKNRRVSTTNRVAILMMTLTFCAMVTWVAVDNARHAFAGTLPPAAVPLWRDQVNTDWFTTMPAGWGSTYQNAFIISNPQELAGLAHLVNHPTNPRNFAGQFIRLGNNINLSGSVWTPIGLGTNPNNSFRGNLSGMGRTVTLPSEGIWSEGRDFGLFGRIDYATIRNLHIEGWVSNFYNLGPTSRVGSLAGHIHNSRLDGIINRAGLNVGTVDSIGGIAGHSSSVLEAVNIANNNQVRAFSANNAGGLFGRVHRGVIANSFNRGDVIVQTTAGGAAGIVGMRGSVPDATIRFELINVYNVGAVHVGTASGYQLVGLQLSTSATNNSPVTGISVFGLQGQNFWNNTVPVTSRNIIGEVYNGQVTSRTHTQAADIRTEFLEQLRHGRSFINIGFPHLNVRDWHSDHPSVWPRLAYPTPEDPDNIEWQGPPTTPPGPGDPDAGYGNGNGYGPGPQPGDGHDQPNRNTALMIIMLIIAGLSLVGFTVFIIMAGRDEAAALSATTA